MVKGGRKASGSKVKKDKSAFSCNLTKREGSATIEARWNKVKNAESGAVMLFHLAGNVAIAGAAAKPTSEAVLTADDAMIDDVMQRIATHRAVTRSELNNALADAHPNRFGDSAGVKRPTIAGRVSRAIDAALGKEWLQQKGTRFLIGTSSPAKAERETAALDMSEIAGQTQVEL